MNKNFKFIVDLSIGYTKIVKILDKCLSIHGISFSEYLMMYQLSLATNKTMRRVDLAESLGMSASGVTRLLNPMEKLNIIKKEKNPRDARVSLVKFSNIGVELFKNATLTLVESLDDKNIDIFLDITKKLKQGV